MSERQETADAIIAEMNRVEVRADGKPCLRDYADRLDAARKREVDALNEQIADLRQQRDLWSKRAAELVAKCNEQYAKIKQVGDCAKLREALVQVQKKIKYLIGNLTVPNSLVASRMEINGIINAALAAPPRNCAAISERLGDIAVETSFNGVEMFYYRQPLACWQEEYHRSVYGPAKNKKGEAK